MFRSVDEVVEAVNAGTVEFPRPEGSRKSNQKKFALYQKPGKSAVAVQILRSAKKSSRIRVEIGNPEAKEFVVPNELLSGTVSLEAENTTEETGGVDALDALIAESEAQA
jgi:hypothetical protein